MKFLHGRCARLTREVHWIDTTVSNLPTFDGLNHLETFLLEFEEIVPVQQETVGTGQGFESYSNKMVGNT
jgi:hypothetical protein